MVAHAHKRSTEIALRSSSTNAVLRLDMQPLSLSERGARFLELRQARVDIPEIIVRSCKQPVMICARRFLARDQQMLEGRRGGTEFEIRNPEFDMGIDLSLFISDLAADLECLRKIFQRMIGTFQILQDRAAITVRLCQTWQITTCLRTFYCSLSVFQALMQIALALLRRRCVQCVDLFDR